MTNQPAAAWRQDPLHAASHDRRHRAMHRHTPPRSPLRHGRRCKDEAIAAGLCMKHALAAAPSTPPGVSSATANTERTDGRPRSGAKVKAPRCADLQRYRGASHLANGSLGHA
jgi:hypothetical protein